MEKDCDLGELKLDDLDNAFGGIPMEAAPEKLTPELRKLYREKEIEKLNELKKQLVTEKDADVEIRINK